MESKKNKNSSDEPRGRTGIRHRMDLRTQGGRRVSWDEVRVALRYIHYQM